jgi:hypothetical protein
VLLTGDSLLAIYLKDHFAGSVVGAELASRSAAANRADSRFGPTLSKLAGEVREDRDMLRRLMSELDVRVDHAKQIGAWAVEKLGRLKLNGRLRGYSPLSRVEELEAMRMGVTGKRMMWLALHELSGAAPTGPVRCGEVEQLRSLVDLGEVPAGGFAQLIERAERQLETIEECHARAVGVAFSASSDD